MYRRIGIHTEYELHCEATVNYTFIISMLVGKANDSRTRIFTL